jgi:hypothetical protein
MTESNILDIRKIKEAEEKISELQKIVKQSKNALLVNNQNKIEELYKTKEEPFGDITLEIDSYKLKIGRPKTIKWDQLRLIELMKQIEKDEGDPLEYIDVEYSVKEGRYNAWGENLKAHFRTARTITPGNLSLKIVEEKE